MRLVVHPGARVEGRVRVPGDKSIAHRWLILAATAEGASVVRDVPPSLDVRSTARCLAALVPEARPGLEKWASNAARGAESNGFTWDAGAPFASTFDVEVEAHGRDGLRQPSLPLDCGNSGTTMRLLAGVLAATPIAATLIGDESLSRRPMERVAEPLRAMGATVRTDEGRAPLEVKGGRLHGIEYVTPVPSAQLKGAILLAACAAEGSTEVREPVATRDHTERALAALGGPVERAELGIRIGPFQHAGFHASLPGDASAAAFLVGGAAVTGGTVRIVDVGLNPTRIAFLDVLVRMGAKVEARQRRVELGEPVGDLVATGPERPRATTVEAAELPLLIDEVPLLAAVAAHADGPTRFIGAGELRVKESDRLNGMATALRAVGASADVEGDDLVVSGGGVGGGSASSGGDHRIAMALTVAGLAARETVVVEGADAADVSFPRFADALRAVGARVDPES